MALRNKVSLKNNSRKFSSSRRRMTYYLWITKPNQARVIEPVDMNLPHNFPLKESA
ncbi:MULTISPECIES: hypothetical protein [Shewanella]|jgi:hypothetical protein|uniref:Uncharacterized protein n=1 Tax=Shewanella holmiensis TaxID=2952222 RepID=A0A9X2WP15_9GAMM|nr:MULTISPECIES: hypothetical protein [Shewanella]MCT7942907.1 hypothetical protein [Shewanella holmiensis]MDP5145248.1 hypothetical protein [Shewanella sp. ULN5]